MRSLLNRILHFRDARGWKQHHSPRNLAVSLCLEAAEVLELWQWRETNGVTDKEALSRDWLMCCGTRCFWHMKRTSICSKPFKRKRS